MADSTIRESTAVPAPPRFKSVFLHVTKACNLRCSYCYFSADKPLPDEMTTSEFAGLWPDLVALGPEKVVFTGGEPLLRPDILDLLHGLQAADPDHRVQRCLNTNGHLVTPQLARQLVGLVDEVRVSLDALEQHNDELRGRGNFSAAVRALDTFHALGFEPKVLVTLTAVGAPDLEELLCFLFRKKLTRVNLNGFRPIGRGKGHLEWRADSKVLGEAVRRAWQRCHPDRPDPREVSEPEQQAHCGVGHFLNVLPNGDVFPCHALTTREFCCGNLRHERLIDICHNTGLIGQLVDLDFRELAQQDGAVASLIRAGTCMGEVYDKTKSSSVWRRSLPLLAGTQL